MQAVTIPRTSPEHYISFMHALNLRYPNEDTGDWHFQPLFFDDDGLPPRSVSLVGQGERVNTNPSLGDCGVRNMGDVLMAQGVTNAEQPVYVANHYRAIADIVMRDHVNGIHPPVAGVRDINDWLDTEDQVKELLDVYLKPMGDQLTGTSKIAFTKWIETVCFQ